MQCLFQVNNEKFLMGGHQNSLLELDLNTMKDSVIVSIKTMVGSHHSREYTLLDFSILKEMYIAHDT